ncbi:MAG: hypothetical protein KDA41_04275 [Planctomycetales bacterium]|nr:hypothetical protein [Planctomycetales bacterium]
MDRRLLIAAGGLLLFCLGAAPTALAQPPIPHELLGHKRSTFYVPRTRPWDEDNQKYMGGGPDLHDECGGAGHCYYRPVVEQAHDYIVPPDLPVWVVQTEYLSLTRAPEDRQVIVHKSPGGEEFFSLSEFEFDYVPGVRSAVQRNFNESSSVEAIYLRALEEFQDDALLDDADQLVLAAAGVVVGPTDDPFLLHYQTKLQSGEVNFQLHSDTGAVTLLLGGRWLEIDDAFSAKLTTGAEQLTVEAGNRLFGGQIGVEGSHWVNYGILRLDGSLKGGVYHNSLRQKSSSTFAPAATATASDEEIAWVGEARAGGACPITKHAFIYGGYHAIYVNGIAVAADQINSTNLATPAASIYPDGRALFHGWFLGLEAWR